MNEKISLQQSEILTEKEKRRYAQQINFAGLGISGQEKIKKSKILVIGAGGKGSSALQNLASAGVGTLGICDNYRVTEDQLSRQHLYGDGDLGKQKAIISREKLNRINHSVNYQLHNVCLSEENIDLILSAYDMLIDATDNFPAHYLISDAAIRLNKPVVYGAVDGTNGYISVFNYKGGPSLRCCYPNPLKENKLASDNGFACQVTVINIVSSIMANEALKIIVGRDTRLNGNMLIVDAANYKFSVKGINKNPLNFGQ